MQIPSDYFSLPLSSLSYLRIFAHPNPLFSLICMKNRVGPFQCETFDKRITLLLGWDEKAHCSTAGLAKMVKTWILHLLSKYWQKNAAALQQNTANIFPA